MLVVRDYPAFARIPPLAFHPPLYPYNIHVGRWADAAQLWAMMHQSEEVVDVEAAADSRALDEARIASLEQADTERAAQMPLAEWTDADLVARFIASKMLPLVRCCRTSGTCSFARDIC